MRPALRPLVFAASLGLVVVAVPGHAAPAKPQVVDAKGDALDGSTAHDVHSVLYSKTSRGFTVTLTLGGAQSTQQGVNYAISATAEDCGTFTINWTPTTALGSRDQVTMNCGAPGTTGGPYTIINVAPKVKGSTLTWTFNKRQFPSELKDGSTFSDFEVTVDPNEPVFGILGASAFGVPLRYDEAAGTGSFTF